MDAKAHILIIDDDRVLGPIVEELLETKGFKVSWKLDGEEGLKAYYQGGVDLIVLDVDMPFKNGFEVAKTIRLNDMHTPIIFLTGKGGMDHKIEGLSIGGDDYLVKPFSMQELNLRMENILRRTGHSMRKNNITSYQIGNYYFNPSSRELQFDNEITTLTTTESRLLLHFLQSPDYTIQNDHAMRMVWEDEHAMRGRSLTVYVSKLRQLLERDPSVSILNVHGVGYRLSIQN